MGKLSLFGNRQFKVRPTLYQTSTLSDFGGGLNVIDNDVTMKSRYAKVLDNFNKNVDGSMSVRWGTKFSFDVTGVVAGNIIELVYFARHIIVFTDAGEIAKITEAGVITAIWNTAIAALLVGAPTGWTTGLAEGSIDTTEFKGSLIAVNGVDKPLIIDKNIATQYLADPATGSNIFTPVSKYVTTVSNFCVMSGIVSGPAEVYISSQGTSGVWPGDAAPNDSLSINLGAWVPQNSSAIIGIGSFRNNLIAEFDGAIVVVELGTYEGAVHKPSVQDNIVEHGVISHRTTITTKNDFVMGDILGIHSAMRNQFGLVETKNLSELIDPDFIATIPNDVDRAKSFSVYNRPENRFMIFVPNATGPVMWVMSSNDREAIKQPSFNRYLGWDWTCGCASERGRVFFGKGTKIFQMGNAVYPNEDYTADRLGEFDELWATTETYDVGDRVKHDGTVYITLQSHVATTFANDNDLGFWAEYIGEPINFDWELPWMDINARTRKKFLKAIQVDTKGQALFTVDIFVDNFYRDPETSELTPALQMEFVAGDAVGYGGGDQPYGGGRRLRDERPWTLPAEFKIFKIRVHGSSNKALKFITFNILYWMGTYRR